MPAMFDKLGIRFQYPDNWSLDESDALEGDPSVSVYSPGGSFWTVSIHPAQTAPLSLAKAAVKVMRHQYGDLDSEPVEERVEGQDLVGFDMNFICLDLTNTATVRSYATHDASYVVFCQADDREYEEVEAVFRAITRSLLS
jgi:hypothetical protein